MTLNWLPAEKYHQYSTCKRYSITKGGAGGDWRYCAWRTRTNPRGMRLLEVNIPTASAARDVCAQDASLPKANSVDSQDIHALKGAT